MLRTIADQPTFWRAIFAEGAAAAVDGAGSVDALLDDPVFFARSSGSLTPGGWVGRRRLAPTRNLGESVITKRIDADRKLGLRGPVGGAATQWPA